MTDFLPGYRNSVHRFIAAKKIHAETPRNLKRRAKDRVKLARSQIYRDDGTQTCREESAVVIEAQKRKAIPVAYVSDSSSGTKTLNIEERLVTWRSYFFPPSRKPADGRFILLSRLSKLYIAVLNPVNYLKNYFIVIFEIYYTLYFLHYLIYLYLQLKDLNIYFSLLYK